MKPVSISFSGSFSASITLSRFKKIFLLEEMSLKSLSNVGPFSLSVLTKWKKAASS